MPFPLNEQTRQFVRNHFRRKNLEWTEDYFLNVLESSDRKRDVYWAVLALRDCGTARSIPHLVAKLNYPMQDVKCTSILTIAHIAGPAETELYARALLDPKYREKGYAMWAIRDAADERAVSCDRQIGKGTADVRSDAITHQPADLNAFVAASSSR